MRNKFLWAFILLLAIGAAGAEPYDDPDQHALPPIKIVPHQHSVPPRQVTPHKVKTTHIKSHPKPEKHAKPQKKSHTKHHSSNHHNKAVHKK